MDSLYWLEQPVGPAEAPRRWSYSALALWRACPRRWWLQNAHYANAPDGRYPPVFGVASIQGRLVHAALEAWWKSLRQGEGAPRFDVRRFLKRALREILDGEVARNPRLSLGRIEAAFSLDWCVQQVFLMREGVTGGPVVGPAGSAGSSGGSGGPPSDAEELWIEVDKPPLCGRIDQVRRGTLVDFKTGEPDTASHAEQLLFYAALWWLRYQEIPAGMEIRYPEETFPLSAPNPSQLTVGVASLECEIASISAALAAPPPPAKPTTETCQFCPVRQLCSDYWASAATESLRGPPTPLAGSAATLRPFCDLQLTVLPSHWEPGKALHGTAELQQGGAVEVSIPADHCPSAGAARPAGAKLLNVLLLGSEGAWTAKSTSATEVFWEESSSC